MNITRYAVLIPAYNEEQTIRSVVQSCLRYCKNVVVVDDGSFDDTVQNIRDLPITILHNKINRGKDASLIRGFSYLQNHQLDAVITIDADKQHKPEDIPHFLAAQKHYSHHVIIGARRINRSKAPFLRLMANQIADFFISWAAGKKILDTQSGFRLYPIDFIDVILQDTAYHGKFVFDSKVLIRAMQKGYTPVSLPIETLYPKNARSSYYRPWLDTQRIILMIFWALFSRGLYPKGLWSALATRAEVFDRENY